MNTPASHSAAPKGGGFNVAAHGLRGLAALGVLFAHMLGGAAEHIYADDPGYIAAVAPYWHLGTFGVFLFFVISGFVIWPSAIRYSPGQFAWRRFVRIYPLFLAFTLLFVVLNFVTNRQPELNDPLAILAGLTFTNLLVGTEQLTPNAWSLTYEVMFYALTCAGVWIGLTLRSRVGLVIFAVVAIGFVWLWPKALFFLGGLLVRFAHDRDWRLTGSSARIGEVISLIAMVGLAAGIKHSFDQASFLQPITWATLFATCVWFYFVTAPDSLAARVLDNRFISYLGLTSYSLYLVHPYTYLPLRLVFERLGLFTADAAGSMLLFFAVVTPVTLALTHIVFLALERWPYQACFHRGVFARPDGGGASLQRLQPAR